MNNTVIDCYSSLEIGAGEKPGRQVYPVNSLIAQNLFSTTNREILRTGPDLSSIRFVDNANVSEALPHAKDKPLKCRQVKVTWQRDPTGLLRPDANEGLRSSVASSVMEDIDGDPRPQYSTIGCDEPGSQNPMFPTKQTVGPQWK
ncbi:hypothetical protein [Aporhodopirellula aestuarii]|uniref:hypothetical protein n=1 Tax=Aporhodopirellula aestuarii TaxID=2950107 RepID=UPI002033A8B1|nr:hypothetical protein [Aporhodopirellula aestuarii]